VPTRCAGEAHRGGGGDKVGNWRMFPEEAASQGRKRRGRLGLNPNAAPRIPHTRGRRTGPGQSAGPVGLWQATCLGGLGRNAMGRSSNGPAPGRNGSFVFIFSVFL
jgi:hypothetical protein